MINWYYKVLKNVFIAIAFLPLSALAQLHNYTFAELDSIQKNDPKFMVVFIHTDWCKYCQAMMNTTLKDGQVISKLNEYFLFTSLNAEHKSDIIFNSQTWKFIPNGNNSGTQELANALGTINGKLSYPTICILNDQYEIIFQHDSFMDAKNLLEVLQQAIQSE